jgi:hypothetical protein
MLPLNDLGSDSPLYCSLLEHPCTHELKVIASPVVSFALWFRAQSRCPQTNHRPCASVETRTCTNPSTEYCSAKCSPLASESPREWIQIHHSVRRFQLHSDRQLANRTAHRRANLRGNAGLDSRDLAASLLSPKSAPCVACRGSHAVHIGTSLADNQFSVRSSNAGLDARSALRVCHFLACLFVDSRASQINSGQINLGGAHDVSKQRSSKF